MLLERMRTTTSLECMHTTASLVCMLLDTKLSLAHGCLLFSFHFFIFYILYTNPEQTLTHGFETDLVHKGSGRVLRILLQM